MAVEAIDRTVTMKQRTARNHWNLQTAREASTPERMMTTEAGITSPVIRRSARATLTMNAFPGGEKKVSLDYNYVH